MGEREAEVLATGIAQAEHHSHAVPVRPTPCTVKVATGEPAKAAWTRLTGDEVLPPYPAASCSTVVNCRMIQP